MMPKSINQSLILTLNCGSSSLKFSVIDISNESEIINGLAEQLGTDSAQIHIDMKDIYKLGLAAGDQDAGHNLAKQTPLNISDNYSGDVNLDMPEKISQKLSDGNYDTALLEVIKCLDDLKLSAKIIGIGHRVVHGGEHFSEPVILDNDSMNKIEQASQLAPLHNPANLEGIKIAQKSFPALPHIAVFDTAFHQTMPQAAYMYPLPHEYYNRFGVRRYGFHGTSHQYVANATAQKLQKPLEQCDFITAHLGNGCSLAAIKNGKSVDTTMGFTPLEGLMMGTRCGDIDPSLPGFLAQRLNKSIDEINNILNKNSGLLGVSGISMDMRALSKAASDGNEKSQLAIEMFCYRLAKQIASMHVALPSIDALIFTGGIGENASDIRAKTVGYLEVLEYYLDKDSNGQHGKNNSIGQISVEGSSKLMVVTPTNEELAIANEVYNLIKD